jgi:hypothetical protein
MIIVDVPGHGVVAIDEDAAAAKYVATGHVVASRPASTTATVSVRALVEVQRRFGGLAPRALIGGEYRCDGSGECAIDVGYSADAGPEVKSCASRLWRRPFSVGLTDEFARGVLAGLIKEETSLPAGVLCIDRAGYDEVESSAFIFEQAAQMLRCVLMAMLLKVDVAGEARKLILSW